MPKYTINSILIERVNVYFVLSDEQHYSSSTFVVENNNLERFLKSPTIISKHIGIKKTVTFTVTFSKVILS